MPGFRRLVVTVLLLAAFGGAGCSSSRTPPTPAPGVVVGSFAFAESELLGEIYARALRDAGYPVRRAPDLASREVAEPALEQGVVDVLPEYLGSALRFLQAGAPAPPPGAGAAVARLRTAFAAKGITVLTPAAAQNQNALVVTQGTAQRLHLRRISDLRPAAGSLVLGGPPECPERPLCLPGFRATYGLAFKAFRPLDVAGSRTIGALESHTVDVAVTFTTDGHLGDPEYVLLADDRRLQPAENVVPVVRTQVLAERGPGLARALDRVSARLRTTDLVALNRRVEVDGVPPDRAAGDWLRSVGLVR